MFNNDYVMFCSMDSCNINVCHIHSFAPKFGKTCFTKGVWTTPYRGLIDITRSKNSTCRGHCTQLIVHVLEAKTLRMRIMENLSKKLALLCLPT